MKQDSPFMALTLLIINMGIESEKSLLSNYIMIKFPVYRHDYS